MILKGRLMYVGRMNPWTLVTDNGEIDLWPIVEEFFVSFNNKRAEHKRTIDSYALFADKDSDMEFTYIPGEYVLLESVDGIGMSNVNNYLDTIFVWLSGRLVEIEIEDAILVWLGRMVDIKIKDAKQFKIKADNSEQVHGVYRVDGSNTCEVRDGDEQTICKIGRPDCCIFLTMGTEGFYCEKFSGMFAREILKRLMNGDMRATRIGNCKLLVRDKE